MVKSELKPVEMADALSNARKVSPMSIYRELDKIFSHFANMLEYIQVLGS